ncbi:MAG: hypothetical protein ACTSUE_14205 [Promethearchaeota archaeon]
MPIIKKHVKITVLFILFTFILELPVVTSHIVGPEIVEPSSSGWVLYEADDSVTFSKVNDLERASRDYVATSYGLIFAGEKVFTNGTRAGWFGAIGLNGSILWEREISNPHFERATGAQYNNTHFIYVGGYGPQGCMVFKLNFTGEIYWNSTFGNPGDVLNQIAILTRDSSSTTRTNGVTAVGTGAGSTGAFITNLNETTGIVNFTYHPGSNIPGELDVGLCITTDYKIPGIVYIGGYIVNTSVDRYHRDAYLEQVNLSTQVPNWRKVLSYSDNSSFNTVQVEYSNGGVIIAGSLGNDALIYPVVWWNGGDGWNLRSTPYIRWGGSKQEVATDVVILGEYSDYMMYVSGYTSSFGNGKRDFFVIKVRFNSELEWDKLWGASTDDEAWTLTAEPGISVFLGGVSGGKFAIVQNPSGSINPFERFFGSMENVLIFLYSCIVIVGIVVGTITITVRIKKRKKLADWLRSKGDDQGKQGARGAQGTQGVQGVQGI